MARASGIHLRRVAPLAGLLAVLLGCSPEPAPVPDAESAVPTTRVHRLDLRLGDCFESELESGGVDLYRFELAAGDYLGLTVRQIGVDVILTVSGPDGVPWVSVDSPNGKTGYEELFLVADSGGDHTLEVRAFSGADAENRYQARVVAWRPATAADRARSAGARAFSQARQLVELRSAEAAAERYREAAERYRESGDVAHEAWALFDLGRLWAESARRRPESLPILRRAVELYRRIGDRRQEALAFERIGDVYAKLESWQRARDAYEASLSLLREIGDEQQQTHVLNDLGLAAKRQGQLRKALELYTESLALGRRWSQRQARATTLVNVGKLYSALGEDRKALDRYRQALELIEARHPDLAAAALTGLGDAWLELGEPDTALEAYGEALELRRESGDRRGEAVTLNSVARTQLRRQEPRLAIASFRQALELLNGEEASADRASVLFNLGDVTARLGESAAAERFLGEALALARSTGHRLLEAKALLELAGLDRHRGDLEAARTLGEEALEIVESIRLETDQWDLRSAYVAQKQSYYDFMVELMMELDRHDPGAGHASAGHASAGHASAAFRYSERSRTHSQLEALSEVRHQVVQSSGELRRLEALRRAAGDRAPGIAELDREIEASIGELYAEEARIRRRHPRWMALAEPSIVTAEGLRDELLDAETLLLAYHLSDEHAYLWAITSEAVSVVELGRGDEIRRLARRTYEAMVRSHFPTEAAAARLAAAELSRRILAPVADLLDRPRLVVVAPDSLKYVPFAALPRPGASATDPGAPTLVVDREIVTLASASLIGELHGAPAERRSPSRGVAVVADPVFSDGDPRAPPDAADPEGLAPPPGAELSGAVSWERLAYSRREADRVTQWVGAGATLAAFGFDARRELVLGGALRDYRIVHFATHSVVDAEHPELSAILLSRYDRDGSPIDGYLRAYEIFNLELSADLVTLSACRTAFGDEIRSAGLVGLTRAFLVAGAQQVVVSLWNVDDRATAELMGRFYDGLLRRGLPAPRALQRAQSAMWSDERWRAPYFWAGFIVQGDWARPAPPDG